MWSSGSGFGGENVGRRLDVEEKRRKGVGKGGGKSPRRCSSPSSATTTNTAISTATATSATASDNCVSTTNLTTSQATSSRTISPLGDMDATLSLFSPSLSKQPSKTKASEPSALLASSDHVSKCTTMFEELAMSRNAECQASGPLSIVERKTSREHKRKMTRQKSRGSCKVVLAEDFVASDESFKSAVSEFDLDDMSVLLQGMEGEGDGSSSSHDSKRSEGHLKHSSNSVSSGSGGSVGRGAWSSGVASGLPTKPGYTR